MARDSSKINVDGIKDVINSWNAALNSFTATAPKASSCSGFQSLSDAGFDTTCCTTYDKMLESLSTTLKACGDSVNNYVESVVDSDIQTESEMPDEKDAATIVDSDTSVNPENQTTASATDVSRDTGKNKGNSGEFKDKTDGEEEQLENQKKENDGSDIKPEEENSNIKEEEKLENKNKNNKKSNINVNNVLDRYFNDLSKEQLKSIVSDFYLLAEEKNISIEELFTNEKYYEAVLDVLKTNNIVLSTDIDPVIYRQALYYKITDLHEEFFE